MRTIRVVVIDDSVVVRRSLVTVLSAEPDIEVAAVAANGMLGLRRIADLQPDLVTLDVEMPGLSGLDTLAEIRRGHPDLPVIMYSTLTEDGAAATLEALALGAVDYATKPTGATDRADAERQVRDQLLPLVRLWGRRRIRTADAVRPAVRPEDRPVDRPVGSAVAPPSAHRRVDLVAIGVSTGGPDALATLLPRLPASLPVPVAVVQHMPPVFTAMLAERLDRHCPARVVEVAAPTAAEPGTIYLATGGRHLEVQHAGGLRLGLIDSAPENSCRPAVDVLFRTAAAATGGHLLAVVLTGMGQDGLLGARAVRGAGGDVLAQDEESSVVWGMPGFVARDGLASAVLPLDAIGEAIVDRVHGMARAPRSGPGLRRLGRTA